MEEGLIYHNVIIVMLRVIDIALLRKLSKILFRIKRIKNRNDWRRVYRRKKTKSFLSFLHIHVFVKMIMEAGSVKITAYFVQKKTNL